MPADDFGGIISEHLDRLQQTLAAEHERLVKDREDTIQGTLAKLREENEDLRQRLADAELCR
eukprot:CAMPEP_0175279324 /NCGR_PEP_ID=MMETSP0093-20121207/49982_1 /TAXON_ID=311494 /ORGANISM="Alexandrium monilatum, Strain CCMP3105" /LENGTH=61 /DNA_ID=CAMNT_0016574341 /DNA_START=79 /DNA_END=261 /DNA_ORIENTATION=+